MSTANQSNIEFRHEILPSDLCISDAARTQLAGLMSQMEDADMEAIRIFVSGGGCSGMTYGMTFTDRQTPYDMVLDGDDFRIYIDTVAMQYLRGVEIDFIVQPTGESFVFNNVFASTGGSGMCGGCGAAGYQ